MSGHLFVMHGDLRRLACDALVVPCDGMHDVNEAFEGLLPGAQVSPGDEGRKRVHTNAKGLLIRLPDVDGRQVHLLDTVSEVWEIADLVTRTAEAVDRIAGSAWGQEGRVQPLIALPLVGTGQGGLAHERGAVARSLVDRVVSQARDADYDVALVLRDARDFAAVQQLRPSASWHALSSDLAALAGELGKKAGRGELSVFIGAGASVPVGIPTWLGLLNWLAGEANMPAPDSEHINNQDFAEELRASLGVQRFEQLMQEKIQVPNHALSHGLLAGLRVGQMVTTNYDPCMETALAGVQGGEARFRVLTRQLASGDRPWLLKLHGDIARPDTLVLTRSDYDHLRKDRGALSGVVQALMLTGHLLFVGFSLVDEDFLDLASEVQRIRREAEEATKGARPLAGTALALYDGALQPDSWRGDLDVRPISGVLDDRVAARDLEIFLDRVSWEAAQGRELRAEYFLDERYDGGFTEEPDRILRAALRELVTQLPDEVGASSGWSAVASTLGKMGIDDRALKRFDRR